MVVVTNNASPPPILISSNTPLMLMNNKWHKNAIAVKIIRRKASNILETISKIWARFVQHLLQEESTITMISRLQINNSLLSLVLTLTGNMKWTVAWLSKI